VMLLIEVIAMQGNGKVKITGQLGDVMRESADIAMSYLRHRSDELKIPQEYFNTHDFHLHVPEGATPKDGPSAGVTITTAFASLFTGQPVRSDLAMTGEITLQGQVLRIGGLREKTVAAARGNMTAVICPNSNRSDLENIPEIIRNKLNFHFVNTLDEVLELTLISDNPN
ncbi:MAG: S16 family serine protease, partial [Candidatus Electryoneaceae bacterium]|nr:S16 family serine protease [Candidatus Electryoneaceae bacterium]